MFEKDAIHGILHDTEIFDKMKAALVQPHHFDTPFGQICYAEMIALSDHGHEITYDTLRDRLLHSELRTDDRENFIVTLDGLSRREPKNVSYSVEKIIRARQSADLKAGLRKVIIADSEGNLEDAINGLADTLGIVNTSAVEYEVREYKSTLDIGERIFERKRLLDSSEESLKFTGKFDFLQNYFPFGIGKETMTAICAGTGVGKSILMANVIACAIEEHAFNCLYVITENRYVEATTRLDSIICKIPYQKMYDMTIEEQSEAVEASLSELTGNLFVVKVPTDEANVNHIKLMLDKKAAEGFPIDCLFVDSPEHFLPTRTREREYLNKAQVYKDLKHLNDIYRLIIWTTVQEKAGASDNETGRSEDTAGSVEIPRILDHQFFMKMSKDDEAVRRRWIFLSKNRGGLLDGKRWPFRIRDDVGLEPFGAMTGNPEVDDFMIAGMTEEDFDDVFQVDV